MKACVFTLGCKMNEVESASLAEGLKERGFAVTDKLGHADLYLINTCAVTAEAEKKSRQAIARVKKFNPRAKIIVCGCAASANPESFFQREGVALVTGAQAKHRVLQLLDGEGVFCETDAAFSELPPPMRNKTRAFVRVQDGCDNFCSYCLIPYLRGRSRSRSAESILAEVTASGAKETVLTGIDISSYRDGEIDLGALLSALAKADTRIRLGSLEQKIITRDFLRRARDAGNVMPHFHLSLQSGSNAVLKKMNRRYTREEYLEKCALIREYFADAAITTDIIVGFPEESEADFTDSVRIVDDAAFARVHVFPYSLRKGTVAAKKAQVDGALKRERAEILGKKAKEAEEKFLRVQIGKLAVVLFEEEGGYTENYVRAYAEGAEEGRLCRVRILGTERNGVRAVIEEKL